MNKTVQGQRKVTTSKLPSASRQKELLLHVSTPPLNKHSPLSTDKSKTMVSQVNTSSSSGHNFSQTPIFSKYQSERNEASIPHFSPIGVTFIQRVPNNETAPPTAHEETEEVNIGERIRRVRGNGSKLSTEIRQSLEDRMKVDLSPVRVHTDSEADRLARLVRARAFTSGRDIFFAEGNYNPASSGGIRLLTHEAIHTIQQISGHVSGTSTDGGISISNPSDNFEREAENITDNVLSQRAFGSTMAKPRHSKEFSLRASEANPETAFTNHQMSRNAAQHPPNLSMQITESNPRSGPVEAVQREADIETSSPTPPSKQRHTQSKKKRKETDAKKEVPVASAVHTEGLTPEREHTRHSVSELLNQYENTIMARLTDWMEAARNVGSAYRLAYDRHQGAVKKRAEKQALMINLAFLVISALTAGSLGWLGAAKKVDWGKEVFGDEDLFTGLSTGIRQAATQGVNVGRDANKASEALSLPNRPINENPQNYQNSVENIVDEHRKAALLKFSAWHGLLVTAPMNIYDSLDVNTMRSVIEEWISHSKQFAGFSDIGLDVEQMSLRIERGIWAKWIPTGLYEKRFIYQSKYPHEQEKYLSPGTDIEERFNAVGITALSGVGDFGWWTSDAEIQKVIRWAKGYNPKEDQFIKSGD